MDTEPAITPTQLQHRLREFPPPALVDVRRTPAFERDPLLIPGAVKRSPESVAEWAVELEAWRPVVVYCVHGHEVSQNAAALRQAGFDAHTLAGGIEAWKASGGGVIAQPPATRWVTRARPKIDRIACPWLIRRFIDPAAEIHYVPGADVMAFADANDATPFDVPGVEYTHAGALCSFDAFIRLHDLRDAALADLAVIVRGADTGKPGLAPESPGLLAISQGLSAVEQDDQKMLRYGMLVYDALYVSCRQKRVAPA